MARLLLLVFAFLLSAFPSCVRAADDLRARLDPVLRSVVSVPHADRKAIVHGLGCPDIRSSDAMSVLIEYDGDLSELKAAGVRVRSRIGSILTADVPWDRLDSVAELPHLVRMRASRQFYPMLDVSAPDTGATLLRSGVAPAWTGYTGKGVVVGLVDTGIDPNHQDFKDRFGATRIRYIWDQTTGTGAANPPAGYAYGTEWTSTQIDSGQCTQRDTGGHGTGVAGIAVGDGSATGNGWPAYRYAGMAPEADIIMVKSNFTDDGIMDGMNYIKSKANALSKPFVINLSIGSHFGAHDGTDMLERAIDQISGQGAVVCTATGNSRSNDALHYIHANWTVPSRNSTATAELSVASNRANPFLVDIWYQGGDAIDYKVTTPNGYTVTKATGTSTGGYVPTPDGNVWVDNASGGADTYNGDYECLVAVQGAVAGTWKITATGKTITQGGSCDAWTQSGQNVYWATCGNNSKTCSIPGTGSTVITAGGYLTKSRWTNPNGTPQGWDSVYGVFYGSSGEGPTRDGRTKPDLCVPTTRIASTLSADSVAVPTDIVEDGVHLVLTGTSMAVPHLTGAVALLLQKNPTSTSSEIKSRLTSTARSDSETGTVPNAKWGYGRISLTASAALTPLYTTSVSAAKSQPDGLPVKMPAQVVSAGYSQMGDRFYIEESSRASGIQVRAISGTQPGEKDVVTITGTMGIADGERAIVNAAVNRTGVGTGVAPKPIGIGNRDVGGADAGSTPGIAGAHGANNVGLLVTVWGRVTYIGTDHFRISDGFTGSDGLLRELTIRCGALTKPTSTTQYAVVTGISSLEISGTTTTSLIRARKPSDLVYY